MSRSFDALQTVSDDDPDQEETSFAPPPVARIALGELIGQGGSAEVRRAHQPALGREVAVKRSRPDAPGRSPRRDLLREAWVIGRLEHPNIVPVHDLDFQDGEPLVVMKQIEGVSWDRVMDDPTGRFPGVTDPLTWNLGVLRSVCNAIAFAHSRGILHRDLKPANVMVGTYGEVYVVDWGLAVSLEEQTDPHIPRARDVQRLAGTPAYLPPEMAAGDGRLLGFATDVYLLGGLLHRIVSGRPLRAPADVTDLLRTVADPVPVDPDWPLADLLRTSLAPRASERPQTVEAFRKGIEDWLASREADRLLTAANRELAGLAEAVAEDAERVTLHDRHGACRFAFLEAGRRGASSEAVQQGVESATRLLLHYELAHEDDRAARLFLDRLTHPDPQLVEAVEALERTRAAHDRQLADLDPSVGFRARLLAAIGFGVIWLGPPISAALLGLEGYRREVSINLSTTVLTVALIVPFWPWFQGSRLNRVLAYAVVASPGYASLLLAACWLADVPADVARALKMFAFLAMTTTAALLGDWRLLPSAFGWVVAVAVSAADPSWSQVALSLANLGVVLNALVAWGPGLLRRG